MDSEHVPGWRLQAYHEGALEGREAVALEQHLRECQPCREELDALAAFDPVWEALRAAARQASPEPAEAHLSADEVADIVLQGAAGSLHLAACPACRAAVEAARSALNQPADPPGTPVSPGFARALKLIRARREEVVIGLLGSLLVLTRGHRRALRLARGTTPEPAAAAEPAAGDAAALWDYSTEVGGLRVDLGVEAAGLPHGGAFLDVRVPNASEGVEVELWRQDDAGPLAALRCAGESFRPLGSLGPGAYRLDIIADGALVGSISLPVRPTA